MAAHSAAHVLTYGAAGDVRVSGLELDALARPSFRIESPWGGADVRLAVSGAHMASNAAAALTVAGVIEGSIEAAAAALGEARVSAMRMDVRRAPNGAIIINDAYNANPDSMRAALTALAGIAAERRVAILGPMAELDDAAGGHRHVAAIASELEIELIAFGTDLYGTTPIDDPVAALGAFGDGDAVLVKASRVAGLERIAQALLAGEGVSDPGL
jgi:UDP-N-acetylmuramoyl-tripeptide--D-alanyl-D-alanine ligase